MSFTLNINIEDRPATKNKIKFSNIPSFGKLQFNTILQIANLQENVLNVDEAFREAHKNFVIPSIRTSKAKSFSFFLTFRFRY